MTDRIIKNYFEELNEVNVTDKVEKKNGLSYLSWAYAWTELKKRHPESTKKVYKNDKGWIYHTDGKTCWVEVGVTVNEIEEIEYLPVMDFKNQSILLERITSTDVNKALQRAVTKAIARHGLGLYIYAGEDLPEEAAQNGNRQEPKANPGPKPIGNTGPKLVSAPPKPLPGTFVPYTGATGLYRMSFGRFRGKTFAESDTDALHVYFLEVQAKTAGKEIPPVTKEFLELCGKYLFPDSKPESISPTFDQAVAGCEDFRGVK